MKKTTAKRTVAFMLGLSMLLATAGCNNKGNVSAKQDITIWSAPSTVKIKQDDINYADKREAKLEYNAVRNEYESQQLMITATKKVDSYYLDVADLTNGSDVISKDNIEVYNEKYVKATDSYGEYTMPDALIPLEAAKAHGELTIAKNNNAALWVTIYVPKETPVGTYKGTFQLTIDDKVTEIPVSLTVNDYTLTDETNAATVFSWRYKRVAAGELDSSTEMMETYYEFFLDYRVSLQSMPLETMSREEVISCLERYYDRLSTFTILGEIGNISLNVLSNKTIFKEQILAVAELSAKQGRNLFDKAIFYMIDEANYSNAGMPEKLTTQIAQLGDYLQECVDDIQKDTSGIYTNFKKMSGWKESILDIPNVMPSTPQPTRWLVEHKDDENVKALFSLRSMNNLCLHGHLTEREIYADIVDICEEYNINLWWYGCVSPMGPGGNYHIGDDSLLTARNIAWIQKKYDFGGNLYWNISGSSLERDGYRSEVQWQDVYTNPFHIQESVAGDGFVIYPGAAYDVYGPLPSIRLMAIRDGQEEYELLYDLENSYKALQAKYGDDLSVDASMAGFYTRIYDGDYSFYKDGSNGLDFDKVRAELIDMVVELKQGIDLVVQKDKVVGNTAYVSYYISDGFKVYIDDELQQPTSGAKYEYKLNLEKSNYLNLIVEDSEGNQYKISRYVSDTSITLDTLSDKSSLKGITVTDGSTVELVETEQYSTDGSAVHAQINGVITGDEIEDATFVPMLTMDIKKWSNISKITDVSIIKADLYNPGQEYTTTIRLYAGAGYIDVATVTIKNGLNTLEINTGMIQYSSIDKVDAIALIFENSADGLTANSYEMYLDNIVGLK